MFSNEKDVRPPKFPLTVALNGSIVDFYFDYFMRKNIPEGYSWTITSGHRDEKKNKEVGGAANSAHMHNLARDFVIYDNGKLLNANQLKAFWQQYIKGKWAGYTYESGKHIHVNLSRKVGTAANILAFSVIGILGVNVFTKFTKKGR